MLVASPEGRTLATFAVPCPEQIGVHRKTGEIYVLSRKKLNSRPQRDFDEMGMAEYTEWKKREKARRAEEGPAGTPVLRKFSAYGNAPIRELASLEAPLDLIALDPDSSPARIWAGTAGRRPGIGSSEELRFPEGATRGELIAIADRGDRLEPGPAVSNEDGLRYPWFVSADPRGGRVLVREDAPYPPWPNQLAERQGYKTIVSLDLASGRIAPFLDAAEAEFGPDGSIYAIGRPNPNSAIFRFDEAGRPLPFPGSTSNRMEAGHFDIMSNNQIAGRGFTVAPDGDIYLIRSDKARPEGDVFARVDVFSPDGRLRRAAAVDGLCAADCGIAVDAAGNVYLGANVKSPDRPFPGGFDGVVPTELWAGWTSPYDRPLPWRWCGTNSYLFAWGSVFKFGPAGGAFYGRTLPKYQGGRMAATKNDASRAPASAARYRSGCLISDVAVSGAQWRFAGASPIPSGDTHADDASCICMNSRLAADPWGRVFVPDVFRFSVWMLDTNGNRICRIGRYGNADDARKDVRFGWPAFVAAGRDDDRLFVSDSVNRLVAVVRIGCAAEAVAGPAGPAGPARPPAASRQ